MRNILGMRIINVCFLACSYLHAQENKVPYKIRHISDEQHIMAQISKIQSKLQILDEDEIKNLLMNGVVSEKNNEQVSDAEISSINDQIKGFKNKRKSQKKIKPNLKSHDYWFIRIEVIKIDIDGNSASVELKIHNDLEKVSVEERFKFTKSSKGNWRLCSFNQLFDFFKID